MRIIPVLSAVLVIESSIYYSVHIFDAPELVIDVQKHLSLEVAEKDSPAASIQSVSGIRK